MFCLLLTHRLWVHVGRPRVPWQAFVIWAISCYKQCPLVVCGVVYLQLRALLLLLWLRMMYSIALVIKCGGLAVNKAFTFTGTTAVC